MWKIFALFGISVFLSLIFHFVIGGNNIINFDQVTININLKDILFTLLLLSNLAALIFILLRIK